MDAAKKKPVQMRLADRFSLSVEELHIESKYAGAYERAGARNAADVYDFAFGYRCAPGIGKAAKLAGSRALHRLAIRNMECSSLLAIAFDAEERLRSAVMQDAATHYAALEGELRTSCDMGISAALRERDAAQEQLKEVTRQREILKGALREKTTTLVKFHADITVAGLKHHMLERAASGVNGALSCEAELHFTSPRIGHVMRAATLRLPYAEVASAALATRFDCVIDVQIDDMSPIRAPVTLSFQEGGNSGPESNMLYGEMVIRSMSDHDINVLLVPDTPAHPHDARQAGVVAVAVMASLTGGHQPNDCQGEHREWDDTGAKDTARV